MNANTVYVFLDPGTDPTTIATARAVLDYCYGNGLMAIMTVDEDGTDNTANIPRVINAYKDHPAILMWALGNEWNLWRPDRPLYYARYTNLADAAAEMQTNALLVKSLDTNHPVASILGEINYPTQGEVSNLVNRTCTAVEVWGANIYRGPEFYGVFTEWKSLSAKPLFLSEFGADAFRSTAWWPVVGYEDQPMQNGYYTLQSYFFQDRGLPALKASRQGSALLVSWTTNLPALALVSTTNLGLAALWTPVSPAPQVVNSEYVATNVISGPSRFFRLQEP